MFKFVKSIVLSCAMALLAAFASLAADSAQIRDFAASNIDGQKSALCEMGDWMYHNPEVGYKEFKASKLLSSYLEKNDFTMASGTAGYETAFVGTFKNGEGGAKIAYMVEYDALRGTGGTAFQGCQHNLQGPAGLGAAVALKEAMVKYNIPGTVMVVGTPAEEIPPAVKGFMIQKGVFDGVDVVLMFHGSAKTKATMAGWSGVALDSAYYVFKGKSAHASGDPWSGRDAVDAARLMFAGVDAYREHILPDARIHGVILEGGVAPNVIAPYAKAEFYYRHPTREYVEAMGRRLETIAKAAAMMTDTTAEVDIYGKYYCTVGLESLEQRAYGYAKSFGAVQCDDKPSPAGSTDFAEVSNHFPAISLYVATKPLAAPGHSIEAADATITPIGHDGMIVASKTLCALGVDLLNDPKYLQEVKSEFKKYGPPPTLKNYVKSIKW